MPHPFHKFTLFFSLGMICLMSFFSCQSPPKEASANKQPNVLILHVDQWRAQAFGYAGDPNVKTPNIDQLAAESANLKNAVSGMPVCSPHRASLMTGQRPLTHGIFMNDVQLDSSATCIAEVFAANGYDTGYIGKWHLDGSGRSNYIPPGSRRQGFDYWKALECTHNYNRSAYYAGADTTKHIWLGYDTFAQTIDAQDYLRKQSKTKTPFFLMLAWGTPHAPYHTAPYKYRAMYDSASIQLPPNVPENMRAKAMKDLAGYYAHCSAIDEAVERIRKTLYETGLAKNTLILFTSDHGDLLGSHGAYKKQQPYEESIRVPMLLYHPGQMIQAGTYEALINSEDIMPTLLGLCKLDIPQTVEGYDYSQYVGGAENPADSLTLISCVQPFGQWNRIQHEGREYRGIRSLRYTYTRDLNGPWLLFDNEKDPYQMNNLVGQVEYADLQAKLDGILTQKLAETKDVFLPGLTYVEQYGYPELNEHETVPYTW